MKEKEESQPRTAHDIMGKEKGHNNAAIYLMEYLDWIFTAKCGRDGVMRQ